MGSTIVIKIEYLMATARPGTFMRKGHAKEIALSVVSGINYFGGNMATVFVLMFALLGGVIGASSVIAGFIHNRAWSRDSLGIATSTALISFAVTALAFGLVCKEIALGGHRGSVLKALETVVIVSTFFQMLYLLLLHAGMFSSRYGPASS